METGFSQKITGEEPKAEISCVSRSRPAVIVPLKWGGEQRRMSWGCNSCSARLSLASWMSRKCFVPE